MFICLPAFHSKELKQDYNHHVNENVTKSKALHMEYTLWCTSFPSLIYMYFYMTFSHAKKHFSFFSSVREQSLRV